MNFAKPERYLDGTDRVEMAVHFHNPGPHDVALVGKNALIRECQVQVGRRADGSPRFANRTLDVVIRVGETKDVPVSIAVMLVTHGKCLHPECEGRIWRYGQSDRVERGRPTCHDLTHPRQIVGGAATWLREVDDGGQVLEAQVHPALLDVPAPTLDPDDMHRRAMRRIAGGAQ